MSITYDINKVGTWSEIKSDAQYADIDGTGPWAIQFGIDEIEEAARFRTQAQAYGFFENDT